MPVNGTGVGQRNVILVFCGPPCAGKSHVLEHFKISVGAEELFGGSLWVREMDEIRLEEFPGELNDWPKRNAAYRILHFELTQVLQRHRSAAVCATYIPQHARAELAAIAQRFRAELYVIQCVCSPEEAVNRFNRRNSASGTEPHAGADLQVTRIKAGAESYQRFEGAMTLDTTSIPIGEALIRVHRYVSNGEPVHPIEWARHDYRAAASADGSTPPPKLLSSIAIRRTLRGRMWESAKVPFLIGFPIVLGLLPIALQLVRHALAVFKWQGGRFPHLYRIFPSFGAVPSAEWGSFWVACAGIAGLIIAYREETAPRRQERDEYLSSGTVGLYPTSAEGKQDPSDLEVYCSYRRRLSPSQHERMPIASVPVFLLQVPRKGFAFRALVRPSNPPIDAMPFEAKEFGFDWNAFRHARGVEFKHRSAQGGIERAIGLNQSPTLEEKVLWMPGSEREYADNVAREQAARLFSPGILPDMRRLFEGEAWDKGMLDLLDCQEAAKRFSMSISVTGLVLADDGYFLLQRRSRRVSTGMENLNASVAGAADFDRDHCDVRDVWDLQNTMTRELEEEIGIQKKDLGWEKGGAFIGAGFNLRYGRDLNLYGFAQLNKCADVFCAERLRIIEQSDRFTGRLARSLANRRVRDKWEVDRIELLHKDEVTVHSIQSGELARRLKSPSRHLMGALYCWAVFTHGDR